MVRAEHDSPLRDGDDHSSLVRLVRGVDDDLDLGHELALGGFDLPWATWHEAVAELPGLRLRVLGATGEVTDGWWRGLIRSTPRPRRQASDR